MTGITRRTVGGLVLAGLAGCTGLGDSGGSGAVFEDVRVVVWWRRRGRAEPTLADVLDEDLVATRHEEAAALDDIAERHRSTVAPAAVEWETRAARVGEQWVSVLYVADYPDYPKDGYLDDDLDGVVERAAPAAVCHQPRHERRGFPHGKVGLTPSLRG